MVNQAGVKTFEANEKPCLMEFFCVLSVGGSLASYHVQKINDLAYKAVLRTNSGSRDDVPAEIFLNKHPDKWQAEPWHEDIVPGLVHAIEQNTRP